ncbi:hypothetical protein [Haliscomenobacter sp.]|uniref:hypothetical protein n=1 Tax=Haliscomenobacter sp. TaxID=2717303 RepID=UPI0033651181
MKEFMELVDYRITEGDTYGWQCFGPNSYQLSSWNGVHGAGGWSANIVFSTRSQKVYEVSVCDYTLDRAYRMINPDYVKKHEKEAKNRGVNMNEAWDAVNYVDLEVDDDFMQKVLAIKAGEEYDTRVQVPVEFTDEELLTYMKAAHDLDITFNEFVVQAITQAIQAHEADPKGFGQRYNY